MSKTITSSMIGHAATVLITIVISMTGFWMMIGRDFVTRIEAKEIAVQQVTNVADKLEYYMEESKETRKVISNNSDVINDLRVELAKLTSAIDSINK